MDVAKVLHLATLDLAGTSKTMKTLNCQSYHQLQAQRSNRLDYSTAKMP
jgi:hypothetical protein